MGGERSVQAVDGDLEAARRSAVVVDPNEVGAAVFMLFTQAEALRPDEVLGGAPRRGSQRMLGGMPVLR